MKNIVLVHGAWADSSSWSKVIKLLQAQGYNVTAPQIPENSLADDAAHVRTVLAEQDGPTLLVGHSYGGAVITALGDDTPNVVGLVYVSAFAPDEGESLQSLIGQFPPPPLLAFTRADAAGLVWLQPEGVVKHFAADVDPVDARVLAAVQKPIAGSIFGATISKPAWKRLPSWFFLTADDQAVSPELQQFVAERSGAKITAFHGSHVSLISHADEVTSLIMQAAAATLELAVA